MDLLRATDGEVRETLWWSAGATRLGFPRRKNFSQAIGFIGSEGLFRALQPECAVHLLTRTNWRPAISCRLVDFILIEPCLQSVVRDWEPGLFDAASLDPEIAALVQTARKAGIPVVGWITSDVAFHELQGGFARLFDKTFCCDQAFAERLQATGVDAEFLPAAIQPAIFNPFTEADDPPVEAPEVLFDGWTSLLNAPPLAKKLRTLVPLGLKVIESQGHVQRRRLDDYPALAGSILGCVGLRDRLLLLKRAGIFVQAEEDPVSRQHAEHLALQAAACRTVVLYRGRLVETDARQRFAHAFRDWADLRMFVSRLQADPLLWLREAQLAWRAVHEHHSVATALARMIRAAGGEAPQRLRPKATIVTPTFRPALLEKVVRQYRDQDWPNKELVVVANGTGEGAWNLDLLDPENGEQIVFLPREHWAGTALNVGAGRSSGEYVFRMNDDDYYGPSYVKDMMLHALSVWPDVLAKGPWFAYSPERRRLYRQPEQNSPPIALPSARLSQREHSIAGFTVAATAAFMRDKGYPNSSFGFADAALLDREAGGETSIAICDPLNAAFAWSEQQSSHLLRNMMMPESGNLVEIGQSLDVVYV